MPETIEEISAVSIDATVLSSSEDITNLNKSARNLLAGLSSSSHPAFFLASLCQKSWAPRVVVVRDAETIVGIVYAKERRIIGLPTGMIFGDSTFNSMIVADARYRPMVFRAAMTAILRQRHVRSLRLLVPPQGIEIDTVLQLASSSFDLCHAPANHHSVLQLPSNYRTFLNTVGSRTRRNFRYYRERSEAAGHVYVEEIGLAEFRKVAYSLLKEDVVGANATGIDRAINIFAAVNRPFLVGLRQQNGEWLSIIGGWYESNRAVMFLQMNSDKRYARFSLSLVARAHFIESLIGKGVGSLLFWAGVGGPLSRYVEPVPAIAVYVDARHFAWRTFRRIVNSRRKWLPVALREWIGGPAIGYSINGSSEDD